MESIESIRFERNLTISIPQQGFPFPTAYHPESLEHALHVFYSNAKQQDKSQIFASKYYCPEILKGQNHTVMVLPYWVKCQLFQ